MVQGLGALQCCYKAFSRLHADFMGVQCFGVVRVSIGTFSVNKG